MSPDFHLNKNSKAMAQLAPLDYNPNMNTALLNEGKNGKKGLPSLD